MFNFFNPLFWHAGGANSSEKFDACIRAYECMFVYLSLPTDLWVGSMTLHLNLKFKAFF